MNIYLSKTICSNLELNNETIGVYVALRSLYRTDKSAVYISDNMLCYELLGATNFTRYFKQSVHDGLMNLIDSGLISVVAAIGKSEYILDLSQLHIDNCKEAKNTEKNFYVTVSMDEIHRIFAAEGKTDKFSLCRYFIQLIGSINFSQSIYIGTGSVTKRINNFVGYMTTEYLAKISGISKDIGINYTSILENLKLIYVYRHDSYIHEDGVIKSLPNHYGRYQDSAHIKEFAVQYETQTNFFSDATNLIKKQNNKGRSLSQKYNALCNGKEYTIEEIKEIYEYIHAKNLTIQENSDCNYKSEEVFAAYVDADGNWMGLLPVRSLTP